MYNYGNGVGQPHIDMFVVYKGDDKDTPYHAFMKNEKEKHIEHLTSKTAKGTWNYGKDTWGYSIAYLPLS